MSGSLSEEDYQSGDYQSDQTFAERDATAFRVRSTIDQFWNDRNKTSFTTIFRDNRMDQLPSYRIRQFRNNGVLTGFGSGEINSNQFSSYVALLQHKLDLNFANSALVIGGTTDYSPQNYVAESLDVTVNTETGQNIDYTINSGDYILNYEANILNYAGFIQYELSPLEALRVTAALRYDGFEYDYDNLAEGIVATEDSVDEYTNLTPKLGINYNFDSNLGLYTNYSQGFTPPQVSTLYRSGDELQGIKPSQYHNYELGGYFSTKQLKLDAAIYVLDGKNTLVTLRDVDDSFYTTNAGATRSYGIEYGISYIPIVGLSITHNGSYAKHRYVDFFENDIDYSDTDRETAPNLLGNSIITYSNTLSNGIGYSITAEHELVGAYNTSFEEQIINEDGSTTTGTYDGHNIFNLRATIQYKGLELWAHALNLFDSLYAVRASYNIYSGTNSYTIGNPSAFHLGIRYNF